MLLKNIGIFIFLSVGLAMGLHIYNSVDLNVPEGNDKKFEYVALVYSVLLIFLSVIGFIGRLVLIVFEFI